ncbi:MAG TPA: insulinase family protein, partial [Dehalococcoidia bacterium]|nr:insulinase family protein [Dehalococcoidia bacterium]
ALGDWAPGEPSPWHPAMPERDHGPHVGLIGRRTEQAHIALAVPGVSLHHPDREAVGMLSTALGEGMSSRLFLEVRERRGLAYDVHAYVSHYLDAGTLNVYAGVDPKRLDEAIGAIVGELNRVSDDGVTEDELRKVRELLKGRLLLRMEDTRAVSAWLGGQELLLGRIRSIDEAVAEIEAVTARDVQRVARDLLRPDAFHLAVVGPYRSEERIARTLRN